jgi:hypothetical protein
MLCLKRLPVRVRVGWQKLQKSVAVAVAVDRRLLCLLTLQLCVRCFGTVEHVAMNALTGALYNPCLTVVAAAAMRVCCCSYVPDTLDMDTTWIPFLL